MKHAPAGHEKFKYDGLSRMVEAKNFDPFGNVLGTVGLTYDMLSRVTAETQNGRTISKGYDGVGSVTKRTYPSGRVVDNAYDGLNRLTGIQQTPTAEGIIETIFGADTTNILNAAYIGKDRPSQFTFGNNTKTEFAYDNLKRLTSLRTLNSEPVNPEQIAGFAYGYDKAGNRLYEQHLHNDGIANVFSYDSLYRLVSAKNQVPSPTTEIANPGSMPFSVSNQWTLDGVDNWLEKRTTLPLVGGGEGGVDRVQQFNPNEVNAYTNVDGQPYVYDESGNLVDDGVHTYTYNYRNLLTRVVDKATNREVAAYGYDALGRRIFKTVDGQMTRYIFEGIHIIAEVAPDDFIAKEFIYGSTSLTTSGNSIDDPIAFFSNLELRTQNLERLYYYHTDALGSVVALTDADGAIAESYKYGAYGEVEIQDASGALLEDSAAGNPFLYTGQMYDAETGFYYYKARYYHPTLGRFLQRDPLGYVDGYNLYSYVNNNPLNWVDPMGFGKEKEFWGRTYDKIQDYIQGNIEEANQRFEREKELTQKWLTGQTTQADRDELNQIQFDRAYEMATGMMGGVKFVGKTIEAGAGALGKIIPKGSFGKIKREGFLQKDWPSVGKLKDLKKVDLSNPDDIIQTIYNKELQQNPFFKKYFQSGGELIEVRPSALVRPAGVTNMGPKGIPQFKVEGHILPDEILRVQ
ncbi:MAG: hypothetical protein A3F82_04675 [Deltaproteobacteria bacterium RIFCSPLOWO2_12_FULL_44_12]|nr:MAG: hypothetical protein A2712_00430 [Deltaproteobacteria bacterium RIFCSPHIGHO2_01_FULL_43_49]OGQ14259.1 MAG: hypothetical protein A3D22_10185 [Deltaproteobacteria bacterium RIFCSPHIGHO2_02_FULL_44_53]OGQ27475.1 MAG: hypothetical protein A3D98_03785 [Deltaproteobacteria bacterium RIFCSPHIGHO2_12_FULL_44_21]OGQ30723.1 MAG: hypothetical protein A2979_06210 [Deltaproteobacteria bacterium RIFCSPLOWO2_01_FULL_45_74]OGQ42400.1 MAG: hypothetical protein A3I70_02695 [Deltaproteobacteria bacterium 